MLKQDTRLWVPVAKNYNGFAFQPNKGWLDASTKTTDKHSGRDKKASSSARGLQTATTNVRA